MKFKYIDSEVTYDGSQLRSLYAYRAYDLLGDSLIAWQGPCDVQPEYMVDGEDLNAGEKICGSMMLHFILEKFDISLFAGVAIQRLLSAIALDVIRELSPEREMSAFVFRDGDDLFFKNQKLSISIATVSPVSALIHFALNISNDGTPVETLAFSDLKIKPEEFVNKFSEKVIRELADVQQATQKVHWVK